MDEMVLAVDRTEGAIGKETGMVWVLNDVSNAFNQLEGSPDTSGELRLEEQPITQAENILTKELRMNGFELEPGKRERIRFGDYEDEIKYLGVTFTANSKWKRHIEAREKKAKQASAGIKPAFKFLSTRHRRAVWKGQLAAIALFGAELTNKEGDKKEAIIGAVKGTPNDLIRRTSGLGTVAMEIENAKGKMLGRLLRRGRDEVRQVLANVPLARTTRDPPTRRTSKDTTVSRLWKAMGLEREGLEAASMGERETRKRAGYNIELVDVTQKRKKKDVDKADILNNIEETRGERDATLIFMDGSRMEVPRQTEGANIPG
ncbi:hypothetical protein DFH27DRAFT_529618 [Peziza echinospora]|nr:hypothetical protein DFH27DRAFT_529618 [Peziza echinospora]